MAIPIFVLLVTVQCIHFCIAENVTVRQQLTSLRSSFVPEIPEECEDKTICENIPNYPQEHVNTLLDEIKDEPNRFNLDVLTPDVSRRGPGEESIEMCEHDETVLYPAAAKNKEGKWLFVVNDKTKPMQGFRIEKCRDEGGSCSDIPHFPDNYKATCRQKFIERNMWAVDDKGEMVKDGFIIPSCCSCVMSVVSPGDR